MSYKQMKNMHKIIGLKYSALSPYFIHKSFNNGIPTEFNNIFKGKKSRKVNRIMVIDFIIKRGFRLDILDNKWLRCENDN